MSTAELERTLGRSDIDDALVDEICLELDERHFDAERAAAGWYD